MEIMTTPHKTYLITKDMSKLQGTEMEGQETIQDNEIYKVLDLKLDVHRHRNSKGEPYRSIMYSRMWVTLDATEHVSNQVFYSAMKSKTPISVTRIYGTRNDDGTFRKYEDSMVYDLYVVNIEELFEKGTEQQVMLNLECLCIDNAWMNDKNA